MSGKNENERPSVAGPILWTKRIPKIKIVLQSKEQKLYLFSSQLKKPGLCLSGINKGKGKKTHVIVLVTKALPPSKCSCSESIFLKMESVSIIRRRNSRGCAWTVKRDGNIIFRVTLCSDILATGYTIVAQRHPGHINAQLFIVQGL